MPVDYLNVNSGGGGGGTVTSVNGDAGPAVTLDLSEIKAKLTSVADANYTALTTDYIIRYTSLTVTRTVTLPTAASATAGRIYIIKDGSGSATALIKITVDGNGAETIDGAATVDITAAYGVLRIFTDGTSWFSF